MDGQSQTLIDAIQDCQSYWSALSGLEVDLAVSLCSTYADGKWGKALQMLAAYFFIASKRNNLTWNASVIDEHVAEVVPRIRKPRNGNQSADSIGADGYRKGVKRDLQACGLLDFVTEETRNGRVPTRYSFPAFEKMIAMQQDAAYRDETEWEGDAGFCYSADAGVTPGVTPLHPDSVQASIPVHPDQSKVVIPTSLGEESEVREDYIESKGSYYQPFNAQAHGRVCPMCNSSNIMYLDNAYFECQDCKYAFDECGRRW